MSKNLYKYVGASYFDKVVGLPDKVTLKCSYPKDFNDPYELFLTINFNEKPEVLAFYREVIGELPQIPTTCFSRSPIVIPMWAHYAQNAEGFVIEFDEEALAQSFPESGFGDIDYQDTADDDLAEVLYRAYEIGKPRYLYMLHQGVFGAAYYTKATCWSYELERRMLVRASETRVNGEAVFIDVPKECVKCVISGPRASTATVQALKKTSAQLGCEHYDLKIGKTSPVPYLIASSGDSFAFTGTAIEKCLRACQTCKEPLQTDAKQCSWCRIDDVNEYDAAQRNTFRLLERAGVLEKYFSDMQKIDRGNK